MGLEVKIIQKGLIKKVLSMEDIVPSHLEYGIHNSSFVLKEVEKDLEENWYILYNPENIGRGVSFHYNPSDTKHIEFYVNFPSSPSDLDILKEIILRISKKIKIDKIFFDDDSYSLNESLDYFDQLNEFNLKVISELDEDCDNLSIGGALFPITLDNKTIKNFKFNPHLFATFFNDKQQEDIYYASPMFYKNKNGEISGVYVLTTTCYSVFPTNPQVPLGLDIDEENITWLVSVYSFGQEEVLGQLIYDQFLEKTDLLENDEFVLGMHYLTISESIALEWFGLEHLKFKSDFYLETDEIDNPTPSWEDIESAIKSLKHDEEDDSFVLLEFKNPIHKLLYIQAIKYEPDSFAIEIREGSSEDFSHYRLSTPSISDVISSFNTLFVKNVLDYSQWKNVTDEFKC